MTYPEVYSFLNDKFTRRHAAFEGHSIFIFTYVIMFSCHKLPMSAAALKSCFAGSMLPLGIKR